MSRSQTLCLLALSLLCFFGSEVLAQHVAIIKPGDVVAGKTLTGASNIAVSETHRMVFRGTFEDNGAPQVVLFDYDLWTNAASIIASTENTFDGFTLSDLGQPSLSHSGKLLWRGVTDQGPAILSDNGVLVKKGDPIAPGQVANNPFSPLINDSGMQVFFDDPGAYLYSDSQVGTFPLTIGGKEFGLPTPLGSSLNEGGFITYVDSLTNSLIGYQTTSGASGVLFEAGQLYGGKTFNAAFATARNGDGNFAFLADLDGVRSVYMNDINFATANDAVDDGQKLGAMNELRLTNSLEMFVGSEGRIIRITPEPTSLVLAVVAALGFIAHLVRRAWSRTMNFK